MEGRKIYLLFLTLLEWFALIAQFIVQQQNGPADHAESLIRFFSYYTILTNLLVGVYVTVQWAARPGRRSGFFFSPSVQTAVALHITVVGLIYNLLLRQLWDSSGLQAILHDLLHTVIPLLMIIYWWRWVDTRRLTFRNIPAWLIYPALYAIFVMIRGHFSDWYPYPFLDVIKLGYPKVLFNSAMLIVVFVLFSWLFVLLGKKKTSPSEQKTG